MVEEANKCGYITQSFLRNFLRDLPAPSGTAGQPRSESRATFGGKNLLFQELPEENGNPKGIAHWIWFVFLEYLTK